MKIKKEEKDDHRHECTKNQVSRNEDNVVNFPIKEIILGGEVMRDRVMRVGGEELSVIM